MALRPVWIGAENLMPTLGFNHQTDQTIDSCYTIFTKAFWGSRSIAPFSKLSIRGTIVVNFKPQTLYSQETTLNSGLGESQSGLDVLKS